MHNDIVEKYIGEVLKVKEYIFKNPEIAFEEVKASNLIKNMLRQNGFSITSVDGLDTAFVAEFGCEGPVIAMLGEYDAVDGDDGPFHGCGHHLISAGLLLSVLAIKSAIESGFYSGKIIFIGCPAEEIGQGKVILSERGIFEDIDIALTWHPNTMACVNNNTTLSMLSSKYQFDGKSSHAANTPFMGRSSLDAAELMNIGANFLREHLPPFSQIQYSFIDSGGTSPNIVPDKAILEYLIRASNERNITYISNRLDNVAKGAALMSGTKVEVDHGVVCQSIVVNKTLNNMLQKSLEKYIPTLLNDFGDGYRVNLEKLGNRSMAFVSSDVGNVSHIVPTAQFFLPTWKSGTEFHSKSIVDQEVQPQVNQSVICAAYVLVDTVLGIFKNTKIIDLAKKELKNDINQ